MELADPVLIVHQIRHLAEHLQVAAAGLGEGGLDPSVGIDGEGIEHRGLFDVIVPDPHKAHLAVFPQLGAVAGRYHLGRFPLAGGIGPRYSAATKALAARRLRSHSQGPRWVSSKSLMASTRLRSALA